MRPDSDAEWVRSAWISPCSSMLPGRSSKISARISASASRCSSRSEASFSGHLRRVPVEQQLDRARQERHREQRLGHRVVELAREVRPLLGRGELRGLAPEALLEALALGHVAGRAVGADEPAVRDHADAGDLHRELAAVAGEDAAACERWASVGRRWSQRNRASAPRRPLAGARSANDRPSSSSGSQPRICSAWSETNVNRPSSSVIQTRSGEDWTR